MIQIIVHEKWNNSAIESIHDIALFKLEKPIDFSVDKHLVPVCLANQTTNVDNMICSTSGWGVTKFGGSAPDILQTIDLKITPNKECAEDYKDFEVHVTPRMICAGGQEEGKGACSGDSGGPLMCKLDNQWVQVGITSWSSGCGHINYPSVYARVGEYVDWIKTHIAE